MNGSAPNVDDYIREREWYGEQFAPTAPVDDHPRVSYDMGGSTGGSFSDGTIHGSASGGVIIFVPASPPAERPFRAQVDALEHLSSDWDSYGAEAPNTMARKFAHQVLDSLDALQFEPSQVVPSVEGGVVVEFVGDEITADIECFNNGDILAMISDPTKPPDVWPVRSTPKDIHEAISRIRVCIER